MAREDLFNLLMTQLMSKEEQPAPDDNVLIQKMVTQNDNIVSNDVITINKSAGSSYVWGGTGYNTGWLWNQGQYSYGRNQGKLNISETIQENDLITILNHMSKANFVWGGTGITTNWNWNQGQWK